MTQDPYEAGYDVEIGNLPQIDVRNIVNLLEDKTEEDFPDLKDKLEVIQGEGSIAVRVEGYGEFEYDLTQARDANGNYVVDGTPPERGHER